MASKPYVTTIRRIEQLGGPFALTAASTRRYIRVRTSVLTPQPAARFRVCG